jgi:nitrogen fixation NifU-like protein
MNEAHESTGEQATPDPFWGRMNDPTGSARVVGLCGDEMEFYLYIRDGVVEDVKYYSSGCADTRASGSEAAQRALGKDVMDVLAISPRHVIDALPQLSGGPRHCAILAVSALHRAVADYLLMP